MSPVFTVKEVMDSPSSWTSSAGGAMFTYQLDVTGDDGFAGPVQLNQKDTTPPPTVGQVIDGSLDRSNAKFAPKLKKSPPPFSGGGQRGGGGGKGGADKDAIERAVAYKGAVEITSALIAKGEVTGAAPELIEQFFNHALSLLQGKTTSSVVETKPTSVAPSDDVSSDPIKEAFPEAEDLGPTSQELVAGYTAWMAATVDVDKAKNALALKKSSLGIENTDDASPGQKTELLNWFYEQTNEPES